VSPFPLSDDERLTASCTIAAAVPIEHADNFLQSVAVALSKYPEDARGVGLIHREARGVQRYFVNAPSAMNGQGYKSKYRG
jgi:hypothetical protein